LSPGLVRPVLGVELLATPTTCLTGSGRRTREADSERTKSPYVPDEDQGSEEGPLSFVKQTNKVWVA